MNTKSTDFSTLFEDLKVSFKFASKNVLSFILGMIGVLIVTAFLVVIVAVVMFASLFAIFGLPGLTQIFTDIGLMLQDQYILPGIGLMSLIIVPFFSPIFVAYGAMFGMAREIVESSGTSVRGVFTWYRSKFFALAGAGLIMFGIIIVPPALLTISAILYVGEPLTGLVMAVIAGISVFWVMFWFGMLAMTLPALIDGLSVTDALRQSITMSIEHFDRVFSTWVSFIVIAAAMFSPMLLITPSVITDTPIGVAIVAALGLYGAIAMLLFLFIVLPALSIALTRVYLILTGTSPTVVEDEMLDISLVGGI